MGIRRSCGKLAAKAMLIARATREFAQTKMCFALSFTNELWYHVIDRDGLVLDTRFVPGTQGAPRPTASVYLLIRGDFETFGDHPVKMTGRSCLVLSDEQLEGANGARSMTYRAGGPRYTAVQLNVPATHVRVTPSERIPIVQVGPPVWEAAERCVELAREGSDDALVQGMADFGDALVREGIVSAHVHDDSFRRSPAALKTIWKAIRPMIERFELLPTSKQLSDAAGVSPRSFERYVAAFVDTFGHLGRGWREGTRHLRVKMAVMLLSAVDASVADVATAVGYGSADAMSRAFRDAGLPAPSFIQEKIRDFESTR